MSHPPASSSLYFLPVFPVAAADSLYDENMKIRVTGKRQSKAFLPEHSEINPAEMEMRHNERMNSRSTRGGRQKAGGWGEEEGLGCYKSKNMFQPVETALSANWPESNNPPSPVHVLSLSLSLSPSIA